MSNDQIEILSSYVLHLNTQHPSIKRKQQDQEQPVAKRLALEDDDSKKSNENSGSLKDPFTLAGSSKDVEQTLSWSELLLDDKETFQSVMRLSPDDFRYLSALVSPEINSLRNDGYGNSIAPPIQLMLTLRFLITGDIYDSLRYQYKISQSSMYKIAGQVCDAIYKVLARYIHTPVTEREWINVEKEFCNRRKFCRCVGAMGGRHILVKTNIDLEGNSSKTNLYYNLVLLTIVDANYNFIAVDIGNWGKLSKGGAFKGSSLYQNISRNGLQFPQAATLPGRRKCVPYVVVAEDAFPLTIHIMRTYQERYFAEDKHLEFNNRVIRARGVIENAIGIMAAVFRIFQQPIQLRLYDAKNAALACVALHNFMRRNVEAREIYSPTGTFDREDTTSELQVQGNWRMYGKPRGLTNLKKQGNRACMKAWLIREEFAAHFANDCLKQ